MVMRAAEREVQAETQRTDASAEAYQDCVLAGVDAPLLHEQSMRSKIAEATVAEARDIAALTTNAYETAESQARTSKRAYDEHVDDNGVEDDNDTQEAGDSQSTERSMTTGLSTRHSLAQREAYYNMLQYMDNDEWTPIGLMSTGNNHTKPDKEL